MLFDTAVKPIAPSIIAEIAPQSPLSKEAAERVLSYWAEREDDGEKEEKNRPEVELDEFDRDDGIAQDFKADRLLSAADYLAPDAGKDGGKKDDDGGLE